MSDSVQNSNSSTATPPQANQNSVGNGGSLSTIRARSPLEILQNASRDYQLQPERTNGEFIHMRIGVTHPASAARIATALEEVGISARNFRVTPSGIELQYVAVNALQVALDIPLNEHGMPLSIATNETPRLNNRDRSRTTRADGSPLTMAEVRNRVESALARSEGRRRPATVNPNHTSAQVPIDIATAYPAALNSLSEGTRICFTPDLDAHRDFGRYMASMAEGADNANPRRHAELLQSPRGQRYLDTQRLLDALNGVTDIHSVPAIAARQGDLALRRLLSLPANAQETVNGLLAAGLPRCQLNS